MDFPALMGNNISNALDVSLVDNSIRDMVNTPKAIKQGGIEQNPILQRFDPNQSGTYQLYGAGASVLTNHLIDGYLPEYMRVPAKILANAIEANACNSVNATWKIPVYSERF